MHVYCESTLQMQTNTKKVLPLSIRLRVPIFTWFVSMNMYMSPVAEFAMTSGRHLLQENTRIVIPIFPIIFLVLLCIFCCVKASKKEEQTQRENIVQQSQPHVVVQPQQAQVAVGIPQQAQLDSYTTIVQTGANTNTTPTFSHHYEMQPVIENVGEAQTKETVDFTHSQEDGRVKCSYCGTSFADKERGKVLPCGHKYHKVCYSKVYEAARKIGQPVRCEVCKTTG
eukprot:TRINITY_DN2675_c1_g1_i1.p1 TRINITY_DN2675_c1_g1~~TRINITY_DN2675_c1_g1_i1.p1  ORF type:complete len:226 (+),score=7.79 TRINITY_DN2675_c1_g1_i1:1-678(+)